MDPADARVDGLHGCSQGRKLLGVVPIVGVLDQPLVSFPRLRVGRSRLHRQQLGHDAGETLT